MAIVTQLDIKSVIADGDDVAIFYDMHTSEPAPGVTLVAEWHETRNGKIVRARSAFDGRIFAAMFGEPGGAEVPRRVRDLADLREAGGLQARAFIHFSPERHLLARRLPLCLGPTFPWMA